MQLLHLAAVTQHTAGIEAASTVAAVGPLAGTQVLHLFVEAHTKPSPARIQYWLFSLLEDWVMKIPFPNISQSSQL